MAMVGRKFLAGALDHEVLHLGISVQGGPVTISVDPFATRFNLFYQWIVKGEDTTRGLLADHQDLHHTNLPDAGATNDNITTVSVVADHCQSCHILLLLLFFYLFVCCINLSCGTHYN